MTTGSLWSLFILYFVSESNGETDNFYCLPFYRCDNVSGRYELHTMCALEPCSFNDTCEETASMMPFSEVERKEIVMWHNQYRTFFSKSEMFIEMLRKHAPVEKGFYDGRSLQYDEELEYIAQCWANTCQIQPDPYCKKTRLFSIADQNHFVVNRHLYMGIGQVVGTWFSTVVAERYNPAYFFRAYKGSPAEQFVNVVQADAKFIGCGRVEWGQHEKRMVAIFCNYAPAYRWQEVPIWKGSVLKKGYNLTTYCDKVKYDNGTKPNVCNSSRTEQAISYPPFQFVMDPYYWIKKELAAVKQVDSSRSGKSSPSGAAKKKAFWLSFWSTFSISMLCRNTYRKIAR